MAFRGTLFRLFTGSDPVTEHFVGSSCHSTIDEIIGTSTVSTELVVLILITSFLRSAYAWKS